MEQNKKFRNHISVVLEKLGAITWVFVILFITNIDDVVEIVRDGMSGESDLGRYVVVGIAFVLFFLFSMYHLAVWSKTYISIVDNSIVFEKNTMLKRKNTIGIHNISNVSVEQNLFEMMMGTCKVKLDTNSMTTAEETDLQIVLKKAQAEQLKQVLMRLMRQSSDEQVENDVDGVSKWDLEISSRELVFHGLFSIHIFSLLLAVVSLLSMAGITVISIRELGQNGSVAGGVFTIILAGLMCISAIRDIVKGFVRYYDFKISRRDDKLYMNYGLFRKLNYAIPIETINGLVLKQSLFARIFGYYMAEIVNIGMGDDDTEKESFLLPYCKLDVMRVRLRSVFPEMEEVLDLTYEKQPAKAWVSYLWPTFLYVLFMGIVTGIVVRYEQEYGAWVLLGVLLFSAFLAILCVAHFYSCGIRFGETELLLVDGYFVKTYCFVPYRKIQHAALHQNVCARWVKLVHGEVYLLASATNRVKSISHIPEQQYELLREKLLKIK